MSEMFVRLVQAYDSTILSGVNSKAQEIVKNGGGKTAKATA